MNTEQELALLPCPFCGGEVGFHQDNDECKQGCHYIECGNCGLFDFSDSADPDNKAETLVELRSRIVSLWNGRAALQSQDREDAERYRWLRKGGNDDIGVVRGFGCIDCGSTAVAATYEEGLEGGQLDAAIDHARRVEGGGG